MKAVQIRIATDNVAYGYQCNACEDIFPKTKWKSRKVRWIEDSHFIDVYNADEIRYMDDDDIGTETLFRCPGCGEELDQEDLSEETILTDTEHWQCQCGKEYDNKEQADECCT